MNDLALVLGFRLIYNLDIYALFAPRFRSTHRLKICLWAHFMCCRKAKWLLFMKVYVFLHRNEWCKSHGWLVFFQLLSRSYKLYWWLSTYFKNDFFSAPRDEYINNEVMRIKMVLFAIEINLHKIRAYDTSAKITETNLT